MIPKTAFLRRTLWMKRFFLTLFFLIIITVSRACAELRINEIMTDNGEFTAGEHYDWIEIYNGGSKEMNLSGYGLSDKPQKPLLWQFPEGATLAPGGYAIIYCTGEEGMAQYPNSNRYYASFKLSSDGETLVLANAEGGILDSLKYPAQYGNTSYGLSAATGAWGFFDTATPRKQNEDTVYASRAPCPGMEQAAGFYTLNDGEALEITLTGDGPIRYTLDGSTPNRQSPLYTGPISIQKTTVIRARVCREDELMSTPVASTFIINDPSPVAVVSLSTDEKYLYDNEIGLFVKGNGNVANYLTDMEHPIHFEYFDIDGQRQLAQNASFRIVGTSTRGYKQKSLGIFAREEYGDADAFYYNPFKNRDYESYHAFVVRSTGSDFKATRLRDAVLTGMAEGLGLMYQDATPLVVYINGEYAGHYNLREKINKYSVAQWEGITDQELIDQIDIVEGAARDTQIMNGSNEDWLALRAFVKENDLNQPENLQYVTNQLDVDNFFTWAAMEMLLGNTDLENVRMYRVPGGKWKYILYDVESSTLNNPTGMYMLLASHKLQSGLPLSSQYSLMSNLLKVPDMRIRFLEIVAQVIENSFLYELVADPLFDYWEPIVEQLLPRHLDRYDMHNSLPLAQWRTNVKAARYGVRVGPKNLLDDICDVLNVTKKEREQYFGHVVALMEIHNAPDKQ
ncbi:MAG: hypothetical protein E7329_01420 [Clostridiales bacterium]|nr:hypothetical protein [Clostridiales bacterium]